MATSLSEHIKGLREAKAAFTALPQIVRDNMLAATETTVREIARGAQARILSSPSVVTRALHNAVAWKVTKTNGRGKVGIESGPVASRAHFIELGTRFADAEPFMLPAAEAETELYLERCKRAGPQIEKDMAAIGSRWL